MPPSIREIVTDHFDVSEILKEKADDENKNFH